MPEKTNKWVDQVLLGFSAWMWFAAVAAPVTWGQEPLRDQFSESILAANGRSVCTETERLSPGDRYDRLAAWVLPGRSDADARIRCAGWFSVSNNGSERAGDDRDSADPSLSMTARQQLGGSVRAPVLDLIEAATQCGKLAELKSRIQQRSTSGNNHEQRCRAVAMGLIEIAEGNPDAAAKQWEVLYKLVGAASSETSSWEDHWPETVGASVAVRLSQFRGVVRDTLTLLDARNNHRGSSAWAAHVLAILAEAEMGAAAPNAVKLQQWKPASRVTASSRGDGWPASQWFAQPGEVRHQSAHGIDFLYFQSPLTGNYEVECEVSSDGIATGHLTVAGQWFLANANRMMTGDFRSSASPQPLDPPLSKLDSWSRYRIVVSDGVRRCYYNGRILDESQLPNDADPWVAIRSIWERPGAVRNLRITGTPQVPDRIAMTNHTDLSNWKAAVGSDNWWAMLPESEGGEIRGWQSSELPEGCSAESLLYYHRPMLEDGIIEYDFYYQPGRYDVHPALGRTVFILMPDGVQIHRLTDGAFDRTDVDPANRESVPGPSVLPLKVNDWNRVALSVVGDTIAIALNGEDVFSTQVEITNQRTFGLFHYHDQSAARVRNLVWRGEWPKSLPPLNEQELALPDHECLEGLPDLPDVFHQDFVRAAVSPADFDTSGIASGNSMTREAAGLRLTPQSQQRWNGVRLVCTRQIFGDFDATLKFEQLTLTQPTSSNIGLELTGIEAGTDVQVGCTRTIDNKARIQANAKTAVPLPDGKKRYSAMRIADESSEGTLKMVRRGRIVHMLIAHGDSETFHYIGNQPVRSAETGMTIQIQASAVGGGGSSAVLKEFTMRSNTSAVEGRRDPQVIALDQYTLALPSNQSHSFVNGKVGDFTARGKDVPTLTFNKAVIGDFDISAELNPRFPADASVELTIGTSNGDRATLTVSQHADDTFDTKFAIVRSGGKSEIVATAKGEAARKLRLIRIQKTLFALHSVEEEFRILGAVDIDDSQLRRDQVSLSTRITGGDNSVWQTFAARAAGFEE